MKILVVCRRGAVRSKCLADVFKQNSHESRYKAARIGDNQVNQDDIDWADKIFVFEEWMLNLFTDLRKVIYIGSFPDIYFSPDDADLKRICNQLYTYLEKWL